MNRPDPGAPWTPPAIEPNWRPTMRLRWLSSRANGHGDIVLQQLHVDDAQTLEKWVDVPYVTK